MKQRLIVFTQLIPSTWQYRTSKVLREKGFKTKLICIKKYQKEYEDVFDEIVSLNLKNLKPLTILLSFLSNPLKFFNFFKKLFIIKPDIVICEAPPHYLTAFFMWFFKNKCKRIYFPYDMISSRYKKPEKYLPKRELWGEKYAFRNCDAIIHKNSTSEFLLLPDNIKKLIKNKPKLMFPPYTEPSLFVEPNIKEKLSNKDKAIHIVHAGTFTEGAPLYRSMYDYLHKILRQGFHLHFFSARGQLSEKDLQAITRRDEKLLKQIHIPTKFLPTDEFLRELSKIDYGSNLTYLSKEAKKGANEVVVTSKLCSYLEAGIPILINKEMKFFVDIVKKEKIGIVIEDRNLKDLKDKIKKANYKQLVRNVLKFREKYSTPKNIHKLITFIQKIIES